MRKLFAICVLLLAPLAAAGSVADQAAAALFDAHWQWRMQNQPEYATVVGDYRFNASLSDTSLAASRAAIVHARQMLEQARLIERDKLAAQQQLSYDLFIFEQERKLRAAALYPYNMQPISGQDGIHVSLPRLVAQMPFATETDYRNYIARIEALPRHVDGLIEQMREGLRSGWVAPKASLRPVPGMLRVMRENLLAGALGAPFRAIPATIPKAVRDELALAGPGSLRVVAGPALQRLEDFVRDDYLPAARDSIGASSLPQGAQYYAQAVAFHTTTDMAPAEIHALGLQEVARLRAELGAAIAATGFRGSFKEFSAFANSDPRLFYTRPEQLLARYRRLLARADAGLPKLFAARPSEQIVVKAAQQPGADDQGAAYYEAAGAERPAAFVVNTSRLETRPLWEMETLALHEAVPGHHLQVARAHEAAALPAFRRFGWYAAYGEGWALYAEGLGPQLGFYRDPFSRFGRLNSELYRAARLVVDTGIHALGWSREQAIDYLNTVTANPPSDNAIEVDRYIAWPGQALAYKIGQLKIGALRQQAESALGDKFDVRRFHAALLDNGPLPLPMLEQQVGSWMQREKQRTDTPAPAAPPARPN